MDVQTPPIQDARKVEPMIEDASIANQDQSDLQHRRTSGRARRAPEMAAGQIPYKGSLVKLAAQRAKGAKSGPNAGVGPIESPKSAGTASPDSRFQSPKAAVRIIPTGDAASTDPDFAAHSTIGVADVLGNGKGHVASDVDSSSSAGLGKTATEPVNVGTSDVTVIGDAAHDFSKGEGIAGAVTSTGATPMDVDS